MFLASGNLIEHVTDHPWPGCSIEVFGMKITYMSSGIASMIIVAILLLLLVPIFARRRQAVPRGGRNVMEITVLFVRDMIARPALHDRAYDYLPFLLTVFVFVLGCNLLGMAPIGPIAQAIGLGHMPIGATATSIPTVCAALAFLTLMAIVGSAFYRRAVHEREHRRWPMAMCMLAAPVTWFLSLSPPLPGATGRILLLPMALLEFVGMIAKCFALMVRLFANMLSGHTLLAVLMMFALDGAASAMTENLAYAGISAVCIVGSVLINVLELLVAGLQAYIFTFLTAMFLGLYVEPSH